MPRFITKWRGRTGVDYNVYEMDSGSFACNCPSCINDVKCWKIHQLEAQRFREQLLRAKVTTDKFGKPIHDQDRYRARIEVAAAQFKKDWSEWVMKIDPVTKFWVKTERKCQSA